MIFRLQNPTNSPIRVRAAVTKSERGTFRFEGGDFVVPARAFQGIEVKGQLHRDTTVCTLGILDDGTFVREVRELELEAPPKGDPGYLMGLLTMKGKRCFSL